MQEPGNDLTKSRYAAVSTGALLNIYYAGYGRLSESIKDLTQRQLNACPVKNKWNIGGIVMHVVLAEIQCAAGIRQIIKPAASVNSFCNSDRHVNHPGVALRFSLNEIPEQMELFRLLRLTTGKIFKHATAAE